MDPTAVFVWLCALCRAKAKLKQAICLKIICTLLSIVKVPAFFADEGRTIVVTSCNLDLYCNLEQKRKAKKSKIIIKRRHEAANTHRTFFTMRIHPLLWLLLSYTARAFTLPGTILSHTVGKEATLRQRTTTTTTTTTAWAIDPNGTTNNESDTHCWNPKLRRTIGTIASLGVVETAYLTWTKVAAGGETFCGPDCSSVLNSPYASVAGIPLPVFGLLAYTSVAVLALGPILYSSSSINVDAFTEQEDFNRLALTALTTTMGVFSVFLMTLLFGVLHENCPFCVASAIFSISLAKLTWLGGVPPSNKVKQGIQWSLGGGLAAVVGALVLYFGATPAESPSFKYAGTAVGNDRTSRLLASATTTKDPPPILSSSSTRALQVTADLHTLNAKMYGAYWCSHCYEQKERLGKEAMQQIPYIECSKDGTNSQTALCREKNIPGYPTWEINGQLFPGEQELDELVEIIQKAKQ